MKPRILVIGGGNHHNALGVIRALGERGYAVELITIGSLAKNYVSSSKYVTIHHALRDIKELAAYLLYRKPQVENLKEVIISCADSVTEHINASLNRLESRYYIPGVPTQGVMSNIMDKTYMAAIADKYGIYSPSIWCLPNQIHDVTFPCITKSRISSHGMKSDIVVCNSRSELEVFIQKSKAEVFAQAYINKKEEVQLIGCSLHCGEEIIIPGISKVMRSQPNTNTGFLEFGPLDEFYEDVVNKAKQVIRDFKYSGLFSFEILRGDDDRIWFMEINFRNDGNAWCVHKSGINLPVIWVKACLGEDYADEIKTPQQIIMMPEFQDFKLVLQRKISLFDWVKDWKRTDYFMEYDSKDKKPFYQYIIDKII